MAGRRGQLDHLGSCILETIQAPVEKLRDVFYALSSPTQVDKEKPKTLFLTELVAFKINYLFNKGKKTHIN